MQIQTATPASPHAARDNILHALAAFAATRPGLDPRDCLALVQLTRHA